MILTKTFYFDSAHQLEDYDGNCANLHGHTYKLEVAVKGEPGEDGMIIDFRELSNIVKKQVISRLDHNYLNDVIDNPTAENTVIWIWDQIKSLDLEYLRLWETENSSVIYYGKKD